MKLSNILIAITLTSTATALPLKFWKKETTTSNFQPIDLVKKTYASVEGEAVPVTYALSS